MPNTPQAAANAFIERASAERNPLSHIEIQNMLYFAQGWMLAIHGRPLTDSTCEAWRYGPVFPEIHFNLNHYQGQPLRQPIAGPPADPLAPEETAIVDTVYEYRKLGWIAMAAITHHRAWHSRQPENNITQPALRKRCAGLLQKYRPEPRRTGRPVG